MEKEKKGACEIGRNYKNAAPPSPPNSLTRSQHTQQLKIRGKKKT